MSDLKLHARIHAHQLRDLLAQRENVNEIDGIFEADLVRGHSFEVIGDDDNVIVLRDASGFDVLLTVTCTKITGARTELIEAAQSVRIEMEYEDKSCDE